MKVREASLDDITAVYLTNPDRPYDRPVESLSIVERIGYGGSWMSVESCAIHLNNMLAWGRAPLVVEDRGMVIAETEYYVGPDAPARCHARRLRHIRALGLSTAGCGDRADGGDDI